jgi:starch synthase (maltosyl-transferring)
MIQVWIDHGVKIFRVDNPHTKPVEFWQWLIADVARPPGGHLARRGLHQAAMMHTLGKVGFQQSYTYYAWRNAKWELEEYCRELAGDAAALHAPVVLADHARHPHPVHAVRRPAAWKVRAASPRRSCRPTASTPVTS